MTKSISYTSILEVLNQRKDSLIKSLEEGQKDKRKKDNSEATFARLDECQVFINLIKDRITDEADKPETFIGNITSRILQQRSQPTSKEPLVVSDEGKKENHVFDIGGDLPDIDIEEVLK